MEWALQAVMKSLDLDPVEVKKNLAQTVQTVIDADARLSRIELKLDRLLAHITEKNDDVPAADGASAIEYDGTRSPNGFAGKSQARDPG
jgi:hypothetical protein